MSSTRRLLPRSSLFNSAGRSRKIKAPLTCPFCSISKPALRLAAPSTLPVRSAFRRCQSTSATTDPRTELETTLLQLQDSKFVNEARLQLAIQGLRQSPGEETVRVAVLWSDGVSDGQIAKRLLRALVADPLVDRGAWEDEIVASRDPLIVRITSHQEENSGLTVTRRHGLQELRVSSAILNGLNVEVVLAPLTSGFELIMNRLDEEDAVFTPPVWIPFDDQSKQIQSPVHKAFVVADGFQEAVNLSSLELPTETNPDAIMPVVNLPGLAREKLETGFHNVDIAQAEKAVELFRQGPQHAMEYERHWSASNVSSLVKWLRNGVDPSSPATKPAVRRLIASLLQRTSATIEAEEARNTTRALAIKNLPESEELNEALAQWAQAAHAELQGELDLAFTGRRWRQLGWWKLYWRVDDVAMLTNEMLGQRFLPTAEQELVYLTGRIAGPKGEHHEYSQPRSVREDGTHVDQTSTKLGSGEIATNSPATPKWPGHISFTRRYLQNETIPALQALAQKLVIQSLGTSGATTSLAALLYISSFASTLYEAGAVAMLGVVYSLGRMQKKWEAARSFWEGEVREEGRKAVRGTEESVADALRGVKASEPTSADEEMQKTREIIAKAEDALARMK